MRGKILIFIVSLSLLVTPVFGDKTVNELKDQKNEVNNNIDSKKELIEDVKSEQNNVLIQIEELEKNISIVETEIKNIDEELKSVRESCDKTTLELEEAQKEEELKYELLKKRIKVMYETKKIGYFDILLKSKNIHEFLNRLTYISSIMEYDEQIVSEYKDLVVNIDSKLNLLKEQEDKIEFLKKEKTGKLNSIEQNKIKKGEILASLEQKQIKYEEEVKKLEEIEEKIQLEIKRAIEEAEKKAREEEERRAKLEAERRAKLETEKKGSSNVTVQPKYNGGKIVWPVEGVYNVSSPYGYRIHPISGVKKMHTGIDVPASTGTNILSAEDGFVITASYITGYGNTVIISHGGGLTTLYGHASKLLVSQGQEVKKGEVIAEVGSTGYSTGPHLHFEVRVSGSHTDPMNYLK